MGQAAFCGSGIKRNHPLRHKPLVHDMNASDFLVDKIVSLPKERDLDDFVQYAKVLLDDYCSLMDKVRPTSLVNNVILTRRQQVRETSVLLLQCLREYFRGYPAVAYNALDIALRHLGPHFDMLCPTGDMSQFINPLYRFRMAGVTPYKPSGLFHIPFELRHIVGSMRYSIPGLPALYLGGSTYVCHLETGSKDLLDVEVSRFEALPNTNLRILNFGRRPEVLAGWVEQSPGDFKDLGAGTAAVGAFVACWPLIALCSIRKKHLDCPFHAEYVLPQLVLQWITRTRQFHGIRYFSTHYSDYHDDPKTYMNYVFPARTEKPTGLCPELGSLFRLTSPLRWPQAKSGTPSGMHRPQYKLRGSPIGQLEGEYGLVESVLLGQPVVSV